MLQSADVTLIPSSETSHDGHGNSGIPGASFNLANGIVGAGIVGLPFAVQQAGFIPGILLLFLAGFLTNYTVTLMIETGRAHNKMCYEKLCEFAFGRPGFYALTIFQILNGFGANVAYIVIIGQTVPKVFDQWFGQYVGFFSNSTGTMVVVCILILLPLCMYRDMSFLEKWSFVSLVCVVAMCTTTMYKFFHMGKAAHAYTEDETDMYFSAHKNVAPALGTIAFAFACQQYSFFIFSTLEKPTPKRWNWVAVSGVGFAFVASLHMAIFGYLTFGQEVDANCLTTFADDDTIANITRLILSATMFLTFPLDFFVTRYSVQRLVQELCKNSSPRVRKWLYREQKGPGNEEGHSVLHRSQVSVYFERPPLGEDFDPQAAVVMGQDDAGFSQCHVEAHGVAEDVSGHAMDLPFVPYLVFTLALWFMTLGTAIAAKQIRGGGLDVVLQITGGIGSVFLAFVFPCATFIKLGDKRVESRLSGLARIAFAWFVLVFGASAGVIGVVQTVVGLF